MGDERRFEAAVEGFRSAVGGWRTADGDGDADRTRALDAALDDVLAAAGPADRSPPAVRHLLTGVVRELRPERWELRAELARRVVRRLQHDGVRHARCAAPARPGATS